MNELELLKDLLIVLAVAIPIIYLFDMLDIPSILGFIVTGILIGPNALKLFPNTNIVMNLAEIGVALLLFTIGIEVSFNNFFKNFKEILFIGGLQVIITTLLGYLIGILLSLSPSQSLFLGFLITQSSSAVILKILDDRNEIETPYGKLTVGVLVFQDLMILPMMLLLPIINLPFESGFIDAIYRLLGSFLLIFIIFIIARFLMPYILHFLVQIQMRDIFIIGVIVLSLGTAFITQGLGLTFAIGAFLAGLIISETDYTHQVIGDISPFKDVFTSLFFISFGMLVDFNVVFKDLYQIIGGAVFLIAIKVLVVTLIVWLSKYPLRFALVTGFFIAQIGEFSFLLVLHGLDYKLIDYAFYQYFVSTAVLTLMISPLLLRFAPRLIAKLPEYQTKLIKQITKENASLLNNHVVIVGYGLNGKNIAKVLKEASIPYIVVETNPRIVKLAKRKGENIINGDATKRNILNEVNIKNAKIVVVAISDTMSSKIITRLVRELNRNVFLIVRTRNVRDVEDLIKLGADEVIPEEFETSIQILSRVLKQYHIPNSVILAYANTLRTGSYGIFRDIRFTEQAFDQINQILAQGTIDTVIIKNESLANNKTLKELDLRAKTNATIIAIIRNNEFTPNPSGSFKLLENDLVVLFGTHNAIDRAIELLSKTNTFNEKNEQ